MKKRILLFTCSSLLLGGMMMSNNNGPLSNGNGNRTGSQASIANCSSGTGCHSPNNANTKDSVFFFNPTNGFGVTSWMPGQTYKVTLLVHTSNITLGRFGFQMSSVHDSAGKEVQAGTWVTPPVGSTYAIKNADTGLKIVEHTFKQNLSAGTGTITINWTAPNTDTIDTVKFYVMANAVNNDALSGGDEPNNAMWIFPRDVTSVHDLDANIKTDFYPNPVSDKLNISMKNAKNGVYTISVFDMNGKVMYNQAATVSKTYQGSINTASWASGMYHVQIKKDGAQRTIPIVKQ